MSIAPLQLPGAFQSPSVDLASSLSQLGQVYKQAQTDQLQKQMLATGDPEALIRSGDLSLAQIGATMKNRLADNEWRQQEAQRAQQNADRSFSLQARAADRADEGPVEKAAQRLKLLRSQGIDPASAEGRAFIISGEWSGPGAGGASLNPVYGTVDGKPAMVQTTKTGKAIQTELPPGFQISREPIKIDTGTSIKLLDPQTRQLISETQKNPAELERQKTIGDEVAKAQKNHPQNVSAGQQILKTISDIEQDPALWSSVGSYGAIPAFPGSPGANFNAKAAQLKGQTFLQAYNQLKGGGAITDIEGAKGENAIARLDKAQSEKEYRAALKDFREVVQKGILRSAALARGEIGAPKEEPIDPDVLAGRKSGATGPTVETTPGVTKSGVKWSIEQ